MKVRITYNLAFFDDEKLHKIQEETEYCLMFCVSPIKNNYTIKNN